MQTQSAVNKFIGDLNAGMTIGTDNTTCRKYGVNDVRDLARKAKRKGFDPKRDYKRVISRGHSVRVVEYSKGW